MSISVNRIPSISSPFTDKNGRITPVWYEFLRLFVASAVEDSSGAASTHLDINAGSGLTGGGDLSADITLNVGAGAGIAVNADDVNVNITNQTYAQITLEDEALFSDVTDNNNIRKTKIRDIAALSSNPGGSNLQVQYNDNGVFGADSGMSTDGAGTLTLSTKLNVGTFNVATGVVDVIHFDSSTGSTTPRIQSDGGGSYILHSGATGSDTGSMTFQSSGPPWVTWSFNNSTIAMADNTGMQFTGPFPVRRSISNNFTASTTQTQGNGALSRDYNDVTTVANVNDTVTLPAALSARYCTVRNSGANILQIFPASGDDLGAGVNTATTLRPGAHYTWFAIDTTTWHQTDGLARKSVASTITASTTQTQGQQPLTKDVNEISVVANANDTVTMPTATAFSRTIVIINNGANILQIFPATGDNLGAGLNTSVTLAAGANVRYTNYDITNWEAI